MKLFATLIVGLVAAAATPLVPDDGTTAVSTPRKGFDELTRGNFDPRWILPDELPIARDEGRGPAWDLDSKMAELAALRFAAAPADPSAPRSLGDVVLAVRAARGDAKSVIARVKQTQPQLFAALEPCLNELLDDTRLYARDWDPEDDDVRDGFLFARPLDLASMKLDPWRSIEGSSLVQQAVTLIHADFEAIKAAENDYSRYRERRGANYEAIYPVAGSDVRGSDADGHPFAALKLYFECDLPFPFSSYACDLRILNRTDARGGFVCDIYSTSDDFHWLAGSDLFLPLRASDESWVATLVVRRFGFDLDGVPDGNDARTAGIRSSLGALKLDAQARFRAYAGPPRTVEGRTPDFAVTGLR